MSKLDDLKMEADEMGITYSPNIGEVKLQEKIDAVKAELNGETDEVDTHEEVVMEVAEKKESAAAKKKRTMGQRVKEAEKAARLTRVIEILDNDPRENMHTTSVSVTCGNVYFDLGKIILPLNTPVEVMQGHINVLKEQEFPFHKLDAKSGLNIVEMRKRYSINYIQ
jgi:hypothetical protein